MKVKFCGITRLEDAQEAVSLGAWAIGLNHWHASPRRCEPAMALEISSQFRRSAEICGVFVNATLDEIATAVEDEQLSMVQLHGDEGPAFSKEVARRTGARVIKALRVRSGADVQAAEAFRTDFHLFDAYQANSPGGTGASFDWGLVRGRHSRVPTIVAGGLTAENVAGAIAATRPYAVDVASGIESSPGIKSATAMREFAERAEISNEPAPTSDPAASPHS